MWIWRMPLTTGVIETIATIGRGRELNSPQPQCESSALSHTLRLRRYTV